MVEFICKKCGLCCQNLHLNSIYDDMHNGNGICKFLDLRNNLCSIYDTRPDICNVKKGYDLFKENMSFDQYVENNYSVCKKLKGE